MKMLLRKPFTSNIERGILYLESHWIQTSGQELDQLHDEHHDSGDGGNTEGWEAVVLVHSELDDSPQGVQPILGKITI